MEDVLLVQAPQPQGNLDQGFPNSFLAEFGPFLLVLDDLLVEVAVV